MNATLPILVRAADIDVFGDSGARRNTRKAYKLLQKQLAEDSETEKDPFSGELFSVKAPKYLLSLMSLTRDDREQTLQAWGSIRTRG